MAFERLDALLNLEMVNFGKNILPSIETLQEVITIISQKRVFGGAIQWPRSAAAISDDSHC